MASTEHYREVLVKPTIAVLYSDAAAAALIDALKAWRAEYAPQASYDTLLAEYVKVVQVKTRILPGGRATVLVEIEGRRRRTDDAYYYDATLSGGELKLLKSTD